MAGTGLAVTNLMQLRYLVEVTAGTTPASAMTNLRAKSQNLQAAVAFVSSQEIRSDRQVPDHVLTDSTPGGDIGFELSHGTYDDFLLAALQASAYSGAGTHLIGSSGDIVAVSGGLTSTSFDFTAHSLAVGQWIRIGGSTSGSKFATAANNDYARITVIAAHTLTLDNKPSGWTADDGSGKSIELGLSSYARNGTTETSFTLEREHTDVTQFFAFKGMFVDRLQLQAQTAQILDGTITFKGLTASEGGSTVGTGSANAQTTTPVLNAVSNVVKYSEAGSAPTAKARTLTLSLMNNLRDQKAIGVLGDYGIASGTFDASISMDVYFKDATVYGKYLAGTETSFTIGFQDSAGRAYLFTLPAAKITSCTVQAGGLNQDVALQLEAKAKIDTTTGVMCQIDKFAAFA